MMIDKDDNVEKNRGASRALHVSSVLKMVVGMGFCQLVQDPVIVNGAGRDAFVARLIDDNGTPWWQRKA